MVKKPNVVLINCDDMGGYGGTLVVTVAIRIQHQ